MPKPKMSTKIREQIRDVRVRLERLEQSRDKKTKEDYVWFRRFFTD